MDTGSKRELAILTFITLDGVMQTPSRAEEDFSGDFKQGGWATPYWDEVMVQVRKEAMDEPYDLLLGRRTYEIFAPHFSKAEADGDVETRRLIEATKYVVTNSLRDLDWSPSVAIKGDVGQEVAKLKAKDGPLLQVHGSWQLIQTLLAADLVDEFRLWTFPVLVGGGKRLFGQGVARPGLKLHKSDTTSGGVSMTIYRRDRS